VHYNLKGKWKQVVLKTRIHLVLELGCGKGEYTVGLVYSVILTKTLYGIDIKGARFWRGAKTALEENIKNSAFLRIQIELIEFAFAKNEVDEIWITFPDPQIKYKRTKHRLTNSEF
jgi:tRNA (guanine-N7-)-methyltransferase